MNVTAIVQARIGSTRLPNKVLLDIAGKPMLEHVFERLSRASCLTHAVLATTDNVKDQILVDFAKRLNIPVVAGSEDDVLARYLLSAQSVSSDYIVRITSDCPLLEPTVIDAMVKHHLDTGADYTSNAARRTFPRGLDAEIISWPCLQEAGRLGTKPRHREHVTPYIYENPERFHLEDFEAQGLLRRPDLRLCVDTPEDLRLIREIYSQFYSPDQAVPIDQVIQWLDENPDWRMSNVASEEEHLKRNRGEGVQQNKVAI